jgi:hypothetical protein
MLVPTNDKSGKNYLEGKSEIQNGLPYFSFNLKCIVQLSGRCYKIQFMYYKIAVFLFFFQLIPLFAQEQQIQAKQIET